ncbi:MAG: ABC transporter substrate-binding protein [Gammaproteobacteria bacterium]|nr:ABC transporter substrate-binding protein [Gammaproteobacteria bacterium]
MIIFKATIISRIEKHLLTNRFAQFCGSLLLLIIFTGSVLAEEPRLKVGLLSGGGESSQFWNNMIRFAEAVAEDLNIELVVEYPSPQTAKANMAIGQKLLNEIGSDAYLITPYLGSVTADLLQSANTRDIRVFVINADIPEKEKQFVGQPRIKYSNWIAHSYADDVQAGYLAADEILALFPSAPSSNGQTAIRMVGLTGPFTSQASFNRNNGLKNRISESENAMLYEIREAGYQESSAKTVSKMYLAKYPSLNAVWTASDSMAIGAIDAIKEAGKKPGVDVVVSGVDWTTGGIRAVKSGDMTATIGGHFMEAGIALILIEDYHRNKDFAEELGTVFKIPMYPISKKNIDEYLSIIGTHPNWSKIDFKKFSKTHNKNLQKYNFSWQRIVANMK